MATVATPQSTPDQVENISSVAGECGCPDPSPDSGSGVVVAASGGGDSGATACSGGGVRTGGI